MFNSIKWMQHLAMDEHTLINGFMTPKVKCVLEHELVLDSTNGNIVWVLAVSRIIILLEARILCSAPEPLSLCTLPLNEGNCTPEVSKSSKGNSLSGSLGTVTEVKYYFNSKTSSCDEFKQGRCGGNSNNFETKMQCAATCLKVYLEICALS